MKRLVLIDGINFFYRGTWSLAKLTNLKGEEVTYIKMFLNNIVSLMKKLGTDARYVICWDGGYAERMRISSKAVEDGIIPKTYKQERRDSRVTDDPEEIAKSESFMNQMKIVKELVGYTCIGQLCVKGEEADDLIGSLATRYHEDYDDVLLVTTDRDYYQLLNNNIRIYNSGKDEYKDVSFLKKEFNLDRGEQWVDVGALAGEAGASSDTIYGVPGIGYGIATKLIAQYGTLDNLIAESKKNLALDIKKHHGNPMELYNAVKDKRYKLKNYVKEMYVVAHEGIVEIARQLKQMRIHLDVSIPESCPDIVRLENWIDMNMFRVGRGDLRILVGE